MSEPHTVIKSVPVTINLQEITHRRDPYLPDVRMCHRYGGLECVSVNCLFVVAGLLKHGHYHCNGYFYEHGAMRSYRGADRRRCPDDKDGMVTHFAYLPDCRHPDLLK